MSIRRLPLLFVALASAALLLAANAAPARAVGYWNMPGSVCQWFGCGYGAGYHAPLILGPVSSEGWFATGERRLPCPPTATCGYYGCGNCNDAGGGLAPLFQPTTLPSPDSLIGPAPSTR